MKEKNIKNKKIILSLIAIIIIMAIIICALIITIFLKDNSDKTTKSKSHSIDGSEMSSEELLEMFEKEGYEIELLEYTDFPATYIILENDTEGIHIQRILNTALGTMMTFDDDSINDKIADLLNVGRNNTEEKQQQYEAYQSWLKKYNITKLQLSDMMEEYYYDNSDNVEIIDVDNLLNK